MPPRSSCGPLFVGHARVGCGYVWGLSFPIVKSLWTSSFVMLSTGLAILSFHWSRARSGLRDVR